MLLLRTDTIVTEAAGDGGYQYRLSAALVAEGSLVVGYVGTLDIRIVTYNAPRSTELTIVQELRHIQGIGKDEAGVY